MEFEPLPVLSTIMVCPDQKSTMGELKLSVCDLTFLAFNYIQKGNLFEKSPLGTQDLLLRLKSGLSRALAHFPPLAGRLITDDRGFIHVDCNDAGAQFIHADGSSLCAKDLTSPSAVRLCFPMDGTIGYQGHFKQLLAVQVTELADSVFIACAVNHAVVDGTSYWHFFNSFAQLSRGEIEISRAPDFCRQESSGLMPPVPLNLPPGLGGPPMTLLPFSERNFKFSKESILKLKSTVSDRANGISSFQALCGLLWRGITRARNLPPTEITTFGLAVNIRHRIKPKLNPHYFGNAIQLSLTFASAEEVLNNGLRWCASQLNKSVAGYGDEEVRKGVREWVREPQFPNLRDLGKATVVMGSSPLFPMYENDFGWGKPIAVKTGTANKGDGAMSALPGRDGGIELEVILAPEAMAGLVSDPEFMMHVCTTSVVTC
ncbi:hypothetical protein M569_05767 [Genlisea aurea]|uniref:Uncharacterized protein n=1 Tax=Genlisea aurea TaxID=192259 RepID=S8CPB1_9LAMI|nr:hypothetical protein M569_05767 [Genlisea aurea]